MQKLAEEKKAEALKQMNSMPQVELDLKRHGPDGYGGHGCRDGRGLPQNTTMPRQHPKQVRLRLSVIFSTKFGRKGVTSNLLNHVILIL